MTTININSVENSKTVLDPITYEQQVAVILNKDKDQFHSVQIDYPRFGKITIDAPNSIEQLDNTGPKLLTLRKVDDAPNGSHFFCKVYYEGDPSHFEKWRRKMEPTETDIVHTPNPAVAWQMHHCDNALIKAAIIAFSEHLPLRLSAQHILTCMIVNVGHWLAIEQEEKKPTDRFTHFFGSVRNERFVPTATANITPTFENSNPSPEDIDKVIDGMLDKIMEHTATNIRDHLSKMMDGMSIDVKRTIALTLSAISTTSINFEFHTLCGIPYITILGEREEWENLLTFMDLLVLNSDGELSPWAKVFKPAITVILDTIDGHDTSVTWRNFINFSDRSGEHTISGWINAFCPFIRGMYYQDYDLSRPPIYRNNHKVVRNEAIFDCSNAFQKMNLPSNPFVKITAQYLEGVVVEELSKRELSIYRAAIRSCERYEKELQTWENNLEELTKTQETFKKELEELNKQNKNTEHDEREKSYLRREISNLSYKIRKPSPPCQTPFDHAPMINLNRFVTTAPRREYKWNDLGKTRTLISTSGLISVIQWDDDGALEPFMGYQVDELLEN